MSNLLHNREITIIWLDETAIQALIHCLVYVMQWVDFRTSSTFFKPCFLLIWPFSSFRQLAIPSLIPPLPHEAHPILFCLAHHCGPWMAVRSGFNL